jgi:hypothetical protein
VRRAAVAALLLAGCAQPTELEKFLPKATRTILEAPDAVKAYRIDINRIPKAPPGSEPRPVEYSEFPSFAEASVDGELRSELTKLVLDPAGYEFVGKGCIPDPGVKIRFSRGGVWEEFYYCFKCRMVARVGSGSGKTEAGADFDPSAEALRKLVQRMFPKDEGIRSLK